MKIICYSVFASLFVFQILVKVEGQPQYVFEVQIHTYTNSEIRISSGCCCDGRHGRSGKPCKSDCNNMFKFCLGLAGDRLCSLGLIQFYIGREADSITFLTGPSILSNVGVANPLVFTGRQPWPAGVQLLVNISNDNNGNMDPNDLELVDRIIIREIANIRTKSSFSNRTRYSGLFQEGVVQLELSFQLCIPHDDDSQGHYGCDDRGNIVCLPGYTGTDSLCTTCVPAEGCITNQGFCERPGECRCLPGYTGALCETAIGTAACDVGGVCLNGGSCVIDMDSERGYRCQCTDGRQGDNCEIAVTNSGRNTIATETLTTVSPSDNTSTSTEQPGTTPTEIPITSDSVSPSSELTGDGAVVENR